MKLQTKIALSVIPLILVSIFILGFWSIKKAEKNVHSSTFLYMNTIVDSYVSDIEKLNRLLVNNGLDTVDAFVSEYKQNAYETGKSIRIADTSHMFIMDPSGRLVFCSDKSDKTTMETIWGPVARQTSTSVASFTEPKDRGQIMETGVKKLYVVRQFPPWDWMIFFAMEDQAVRDSTKQIRNATIGIAGICSVLCITMILLVFRKFFVVPVKKLGESASSIAQGRFAEKIDITSSDELGDLARNMETLSDSIQKHQAEIKQSHDQLEQKVKDRTVELETAVSKIKTLKGLLPICMHCKKIRDDKGYWNQMEAYIHEHSDAEFSHSICLECAEKHYPGLDLYDE